MGTAPKVYKYDDANAPVLSGTRGSLVALLKAILIDGYGDKTPPGGWTMPFIDDNAQKAVFRNDPSAGTGFFLRVNELSSPVANQPTFLAYEVMTDIDNGAQPFMASEMPLYTSYHPDTTPRPWIAFATTTCIYLFWYRCSATTDTLGGEISIDGFFFGDIIPAFPDDAYACCFAAVCQTNNYWGLGTLTVSNQISGVTSRGICFPRALNAFPSPILSALVPGGGPIGFTSAWWNANPSYVSAYSAGSRFFMQRPLVSDSDNFSARGWLPGFYMSCHQISFDQFAVETDGDKSFMSISGFANNRSGQNVFFMMDLTGDSWQ